MSNLPPKIIKPDRDIQEYFDALQRFIKGKPKICIPVEQDDDDLIIAEAFYRLEEAEKKE